MSSSHYDNDVAMWSPDGTIKQLGYANESVNLGSAVLGLKSNTHVVLAAFKRATTKLGENQDKIVEIDTHVGQGSSGLVADSLMLAEFMQEACADYRWSFGTAAPIDYIADRLLIKLQKSTQNFTLRPYGVGLLIGGFDAASRLYRALPSSEVDRVKYAAIGCRAQSAETYLDKNVESFNDASLEDLVKHAVNALRKTLPEDKSTTLTKENTAIAIVGERCPFKLLKEEEVETYIQAEDTAAAAAVAGTASST